MKLATLVGVVIAAALPACDKADRESVAVRNNTAQGEVRIVNIRADDCWEHEATHLLSQTPAVQIGMQEGPSTHALFQVRAARRLANGSIVVANGSPAELRVYSRNGEFLRAFGRTGRGPGEFSHLSWVQILPGDTIVAADGALQRLTAFNPDGEMQWTRSFTAGPGFWLAIEFPGDFILPDGSFVVAWDAGGISAAIRNGNVRPGMTARSRADVLYFDAKGTLIDTIAQLPSLERSVFHDTEGDIATAFAFLGRMLAYAVGSRGIFLGTQETWEIATFTPRGVPVSVLRDPGATLEVTPEVIGRFESPLLERAGTSAALRQYVDEMVSERARPSTRPAYGRLLLDAAQRLWVSEAFNPLGTPARWCIIDPDSGVLGRVQLPERFALHEVGEDYVLGRWADERGVEYVREYALRTESR